MMGVAVMEKKNDVDEVVKLEKEAAEKKLFAGLEARDRLRRLADAVPRCPLTAEEIELAALRSYIDQWSTWMKRDDVEGKLPHATSFAEEGRSWAHSILDPLDVPNMWAIKIVDAAMIELACLPGGMRMRHALKIRWLNEHLDMQVFRSGRLSPEEVDDLADAAERHLIPMTKRRGLPLI